jgi:hypothetical protein
MTLNKHLLETSEVYREIAALNCFQDIPFELEDSDDEINNDDEVETQQEEDFWEWDEEKQCWIGGI